MKYLNTFFLTMLFGGVIAQPIINFNLHQYFGSEWGYGIAEDLVIADLLVTAAGENLTWDYTFIGELDNGNGVLFSEANLNDFFMLLLIQLKMFHWM